MKEDLGPYMIPNSLDFYDTHPFFQSNAEKELSLSQVHLKSAADSDAPELKELHELLTTTTSAYLANFKVDSNIPYHMRHSFDRDMELFRRISPTK